uniref:Uncharacterized protein n=1 Tax=Strix occidentalis caurina TaxID=311401 RepID=A0A8D0ELG4_STROC
QKNGENLPKSITAHVPGGSQLCPAAPRHRSHSSSATGPSACRLCPAGWQLFAAKCYWISTKTESWEKAAKDCLDQRSQLVKLESAEEKVSNCRGGKRQRRPRIWLF